MSIQFCTIASGSSGNSAFVSTGKNKFLIDAGLSGRALEELLALAGINASEISGIFITHEHSDHTKGAGILSRRFDIPVYMTAGTQLGAELGKIPPRNLFLVREDTPVFFDDAEITPFAIAHDANQPVGYRIKTDKHKIAIATDLGHICDNAVKYFADADIILIEANHDIDMLCNGRYPRHLKQRILSDIGHLSNVACGTFLAQNYSSKNKHIFLGHLSQENNRPEIAYETVKNVLITQKINIGSETQLHLANRSRPSQMVLLS
ncbi:MAG: MBL fold metallo-hydrolase [Defluviitaleaceae bacterium]|nr:MBL fold metallo-hydrolase [Defluviitaleaceae bacterium]